MAIRRVPEITAEMENFRTVPFVGTNMFTSKRDPVEPVPAGTYVAMVFRVTGYDPDCDGSLMARLEHVNAEGEPSGWEPTHLGLYPDTDWVIDGPGELDRVSAKLAEIRELAESLGDRSNEPPIAGLRPGDAGRRSDRRLMEPLRRMLLEILDRP